MLVILNHLLTVCYLLTDIFLGIKGLKLKYVIDDFSYVILTVVYKY